MQYKNDLDDLIYSYNSMTYSSSMLRQCAKVIVKTIRIPQLIFKKKESWAGCKKSVN